jgi:hypothetical protein
MNDVDLSKLPIFKVENVGDGIATGTHTPSRCVGERYMAVLFASSQPLRGRFKDVDPLALRATFQLDDPDQAQHLDVGDGYPFADTYYGDRIILALDGPTGWEPVQFSASDAVSPDGGVWRKATGETPLGWHRLQGGWDHEHCVICCASIGPGNAAFTRDDEFICPVCHEHVLVNGSIDFIVPEQM